MLWSVTCKAWDLDHFKPTDDNMESIIFEDQIDGDLRKDIKKMVGIETVKSQDEEIKSLQQAVTSLTPSQKKFYMHIISTTIQNKNCYVSLAGRYWKTISPEKCC
jgi:hypothetical protein